MCISLECDTAQVREDGGQLEACAVITKGSLAIDIEVGISTSCSGPCGMSIFLYVGGTVILNSCSHW